MKETIRVLLSEEEVDRRIKEVADQINRDYAGKEVHLICVLKGGVFFMCELAKRITVPVSLDFMSVSSYGDDTKSSGVVRIVKDLDQPLEGKDVLIVEDIIDSGRTLYYLIDILKKRNPKSVHLCTLLDKPERRVRDVKVDYTGKDPRFLITQEPRSEKQEVPVKLPPSGLPCSIFVLQKAALLIRIYKNSRKSG